LAAESNRRQRSLQDSKFLTLPLIHEFLSLMLGVRRAGVTEALHALRERALIAYGRGQIAVKDRKGMERTAGEAYGTPEAEYRRLIG
jgi:CRP-like cAMP-binding protein